ncbi:MAG: CpaF family protein [Castellaniella sp.]|uniref:CpaF family protein n=1 Tax=Castellaniella sp. TaxID=1955812 RepID=UPI0011F9B3B2|nr:CpaF family protein [Castellaniella sp.]TAN27931.1 MAG: CpaF family protein [Castellaniella sp.]
MMFGRKLLDDPGVATTEEPPAGAAARAATMPAAEPLPASTVPAQPAVPAVPKSPLSSRHPPKHGPATATVGDRRRSVRPENVIRSENYSTIRQAVFASLDIASALTRPVEQVRVDVEAIAGEVIRGGDLPITQTEQRVMVQEILNDMFGVGPIEPLLQDETVDDIMVNGPDQVFVERFGKLELTDVKFRDNAHVVSVAQRIASSVGRRVDESSPMVDARLQDGSRVNVIIPPLAIDGASISIRKFSRKEFTLPRLVARGTLTPAMMRVLEIAAACRLNIIVAGGTGSGKTTMLNALSRYISETDRIVTIEDAAELQLQQPHVVRLETRPPSIEGTGAINQGDLMRNALRMRPDRIILGETRGAEAFDVLQAMNTGHDGSMTTLHANSPRDAITRLESMVMMANGNLPLFSIRHQIAAAVNLIVQVGRLRDGTRKITHITEIAGTEGDVIITQDLFHFAYNTAVQRDDVSGTHESTGMRPVFTDRARYYGMEAALMEAMRP